jgi:hypothetical protein
MSSKAIVVFTVNSPKQIINAGGSRAWGLDPSRASQCDFLVCTYNKYLDITEEHRAAFLVGKISDVVRDLPEESDDVRYLIKISDFALTHVPEAWGKWRNPVHYATLEQLNIDPAHLNFQPMPEKSAEAGEQRADADDRVKPMTIVEAKQGLAAFFGVRPEAIEIVIHGKGKIIDRPGAVQPRRRRPIYRA